MWSPVIASVNYYYYYYMLDSVMAGDHRSVNVRDDVPS